MLNEGHLLSLLPVIAFVLSLEKLSALMTLLCSDDFPKMVGPESDLVLIVTTDNKPESEATITYDIKTKN